MSDRSDMGGGGLTADLIHRFLFEDLDIRGAHVRLEKSWQAIIEGRNYPAPATHVLGEVTAICGLIAANLKQAGRLTFQLRGDGKLPMLVVDCNGELNIRGYASVSEGIEDGDGLDVLLGDGRLLMTLDVENSAQPFQSYVPIEGDSVAAVFEHYLVQSEQQPAWLMLCADGQHASGLFLQKLPGADQKDEDGWARITQLAATLREDELLSLDAVSVLMRLFHEETVRVFEPRTVVHDYPPDREKVATMLRSLGREEIERIIEEHGEVSVHDDLSNHTYLFNPEEARQLFEHPPTLH